MLKDKDMIGTVRALKNNIDYWLIAGLNVARGASGDEMQKALKDADIEKQDHIYLFQDVQCAYAYALKHVISDDRICVLDRFIPSARYCRIVAEWFLKDRCKRWPEMSMKKKFL